MMLAGAFHRISPHDPSLESTLVVPRLLVSFSVTPTATSSERRPLLPLRAFTQGPLSMQERRPSLLSAISSRSPHALKVPLFATSRRKLVTVVHSHVPLEIMPPSSVTLPMRTRLAFVSHLVQRKLSPAAHALLSVSLLVAGVSTSLCLRLAEHITNTRPNATSRIHLKQLNVMTLTDL